MRIIGTLRSGGAREGEEAAKRCNSGVWQASPRWLSHAADSLLCCAFPLQHGLPLDSPSLLSRHPVSFPLQSSSITRRYHPRPPRLGGQALPATCTSCSSHASSDSRLEASPIKTSPRENWNWSSVAAFIPRQRDQEPQLSRFGLLLICSPLFSHRPRSLPCMENFDLASPAVSRVHFSPRVLALASRMALTPPSYSLQIRGSHPRQDSFFDAPPCRTSRSFHPLTHFDCATWLSDFDSSFHPLVRSVRTLSPN